MPRWGEREREREGWKRREAPCKCWKEGGRWDEPHSPLPRNDHLRTQRSLGQAPPAPGHTSRGSGTHSPSALDAEGQLRRPGQILPRPGPPPGHAPPLALPPIQPLLTWGPQEGRGWGARAPGGEGRTDQGKPPAWRARGAPPPGRIQQAEAQEQGPATRAGLGVRRGLGAAAWGWTWVTCGRQGTRDHEERDERLRPELSPSPQPGAGHTHARKPRRTCPRCAPQLKPRPTGFRVPAPPRPQPAFQGKPHPATNPAPL